MQCLIVCPWPEKPGMDALACCRTAAGNGRATGISSESEKRSGGKPCWIYTEKFLACFLVHPSLWPQVNRRE